jgi:hypothetical protein
MIHILLDGGGFMRSGKLERPLIMLSLDAISDHDIEYLLTLPNFRKLASWGLLHQVGS